MSILIYNYVLWKRASGCVRNSLFV